MGRKRQRDDPVQDIYRDVSKILLRGPARTPGTPHSFFESSYDVHVLSTKLVLHTHSNGLCVLTCGQVPSQTIKSIEFLVRPLHESSAAERRKLQASTLKKGVESNTLPSVVLPTTKVANLTLNDGTVQPVFAGIWGTLIENNHNLSPELLQRDPLLDGYIAIIHPATGSFPPRTLDQSLLETKGPKKSCTDSINIQTHDNQSDTINIQTHDNQSDT